MTIAFHRPGGPTKAVVVEVKQSKSPDYLVKGLDEALVYRHEYDAMLVGWPKALVVAEDGFIGAPRRADDVVAMNWDGLLPHVVVAALADAATL